MNLKLTIVFLLGIYASSAQKLPDEMYFVESDHIMYTGGIPDDGLYDTSKVRRFDLIFSQPNYWTLLTNNYQSHTDLPAKLAVDGDTLTANVGVRFKGATSYGRVTTMKKSFNITIDYENPDQRLKGYKELNLNNSYEDPSFMREVLYTNSIRRFTPVAKSCYVHLYINGIDWGLYPHVQQLNSDYIKDWFFSNDGSRWRADRPDGQLGGVGGGSPWGDGTTALNYLGSDTSKYKTYYTLKSSGQPDPWRDLVYTTQVLNTTPASELEQKIKTVMDLDKTLWFLATEIAFSDDDSYIFKGRMDYWLYWDAETKRMTPLEYDGNSSFYTQGVNWGAFYNADKVNYPLLNKLLAVPNIRQRYLAHLRTIIKHGLDAKKFKAMQDQFNRQIDALVQADPKKLYTYNNFNIEKNNLVNFVNNHRNVLNGNLEVKEIAPGIQMVRMQSKQGEWKNPKADDSPIISATLTNAVAARSVSLYYTNALYGDFTKIQMYDDGLHDDGAAGDLTFATRIPAFDIGTHVRFYVEARANNVAGTISYSPEGAEHDVFYYQVESELAQAKTVVINEIMSLNKTTVQDEAGDYADWIELYNTTANDVDLSGYFLTDDLTRIDKWAIPDGTVLKANEYMIVWADEDKSQGPFHANFKLSGSGEQIALANPQKILLDTVIFGQQQDDKGYARVPNGTGSFVIQNPTFLKNNVSTSISQEELASHIQIFPNPADGYFNVNLEHDNFTNQMLNISDLQGKLIFQKEAESHQIIDINGWNSGYYIIHIGGLHKKLLVR